MAQLMYVDETLLQDSDKWGVTDATFEKVLSTIIDDTTKYKDEKALLAAFTPTQRKVVEQYFKGYAIDTYSELEGTVRLQIAQKDAKIKQKLQEMEKDLGFPIKADEWVYDGFKDLVDERATCHFCNHKKATLRYVHYAVNKKRNVTLRFGYDCAASFFATAPDTFTTIKTLYSKLLCDVKTVACICDELKQGKTEILKNYYRYKGRYIGRLFLKNGTVLPISECIKQLEELYSFKIATLADGKTFKGDAQRGYEIIYTGSGKSVVRDEMWVKNHIVYCLNADLDNKYNSPLANRKLVAIDMEANTKNDTTMFVNCAINFLKVGLPVPPMICDKLTLKISNATKQHHPDYLRFASDMLMHKHLAKTSLLRTALTEFFVDYVTTKNNPKLRDEELQEWGINGPASYYTTVLNWEAAVVRLQGMYEYEKLLKAGYISATRLNMCPPQRMALSTANIPDFLNRTSTIRKYARTAMELFLTNKPVIRDDSRVLACKSKYQVQGVDTDITLGTKNRFDDIFIDARYAPYHITVAYKLYQLSLERMLLTDFVTFKTIAGIIAHTESTEQLLQVLIAFEMCGKHAYNLSSELLCRYKMDKTIVAALLKKWYKNTSDPIVKELLQDNTLVQELEQFKDTVVSLWYEITELAQKLNTIDLCNVKIKDVQAENKLLFADDSTEKPQKTVLDYYKDYCCLLTHKPATATITNLVESNGIAPILVFKTIQPYKTMYERIVNKCNEEYVFQALDYYGYKTKLTTYFNRLNSALDNFDLVLKTWLVEEDKTDVTQGTSPAIYDVKQIDSDVYNYLHDVVYSAAGGIVEIKDEVDKLRTEYVSICKAIQERKDLIKILTRIIKYGKCTVKIQKSQLLAIKSIQELFTLINPDMQFFSENTTTDKQNICKYLEEQAYLGLTELYREKVHRLLDKAYTEYMQENAARLEEKAKQEKIKKMIETINRTCKEHIDVFNFEVTPELKKKYKKRTDADIARKETFRVTTFENNETKLKHFYATIVQLAFSNECVPYLEMAQKHIEGIEILDKRQVQAVVAVLCAELYNDNKIMNHTKTATVPVLEKLQSIDLSTMPFSVVQQIHDIISVYYLTYTDMCTLCKLLEEQGNCVGLTEEFEKAVKALAAVPQINLADRYAIACDIPDKSGLTAVEKAELILEKKDTIKIDTFCLDVCSTVVKYKSCSERQRLYVDKAYDVLIQDAEKRIKSSTTKPKKQVQTVKETKAATTTTEPTSTTEVNTENTQELTIAVEFAKRLREHEDFETLQDINKAIIATVLRYKKCSVKQLRWIKLSAEALGVEFPGNVNV